MKDEKGSIKWVIESRRNDADKSYKCRTRDGLGRLRYCEKCRHTWEIIMSGSQRSYTHMPTYKLPRVTCRICKKAHED